MSIKKLAAGFFLGLGIWLFAAGNAHATEGQIELRNQIKEDSRCYAVSGYLPGEAQYNIVVICRDLIYPATAEATRYVVWITPTNSNTPQRIGELAFGKVLLKTKTPFSSMFVTQEKDTNVKTPSGTTVLRGNVRNIPFLDPNGTAAPSVLEPEATLSPSPTPAARGNVLSVFRTGAFITIAAIFIIIVMLVLVKPFK